MADDENTAEKRADKLWNFFDKGENGEMQRGGWRHDCKLYSNLMWMSCGVTGLL